MINKNDSLLDIAKVVVEESKRPLAISEIVEKVFDIKGVTPTQDEITQFGIDFMLSGDFICCGTNKKENLWDLKSRQSVSLLDKDGGYLDDIHEDDEEVKKNELKEEPDYDEENNKNFDTNDDDDDESLDEPDEVAEELGLINVGQDEEDGFAATQEIDVDHDDEDEENENESNEDTDLEDVVEGEFK